MINIVSGIIYIPINTKRKIIFIKINILKPIILILINISIMISGHEIVFFDNK
jgi:hypothetical protein